MRWSVLQRCTIEVGLMSPQINCLTFRLVALKVLIVAAKLGIYLSDMFTYLTHLSSGGCGTSSCKIVVKKAALIGVAALECLESHQELGASARFRRHLRIPGGGPPRCDGASRHARRRPFSRQSHRAPRHARLERVTDVRPDLKAIGSD